MKNSKTKKILSILLAVVMVLSMISMSVSAAAPAKPTGLSWDGTTAKWNAVSGAEKYIVELWVGSDEDYLSQIETTSTSYNWDSWMVSGQTYDFRVNAVGADVASGWTDWSAKYTKPGSLGTISGITWSGYNLSWNDYTGETGYYISVEKYDGSNWIQLDIYIIKANITEINLSNTLAKGGTGDYRVEVSAYLGKMTNYMAVSTVTKTFNKVPLLIDNVEINDIEAPVAGEYADEAPQGLLPVDANYKIKSARWLNSNGEAMSASDSFVALTKYAAEFTLEPISDDYLFVTDSADLTATLNGSAASVKSINDDGTVNVRISLKAPAKKHIISATASPAEGGTITGTGTYETGDMVYMNAHANDGYKFVKWTENGVTVSENASYTIASLDKDRNLVAVFEVEEDTCTITATASPTAGGTISGDGTYAKGTMVHLNATANSGYKFVKWTENGVTVSENASYTITSLDKDRNLVAVFEDVGSSASLTIPETVGTYLDTVSSTNPISVPTGANYNVWRLYDLKVNGTYLSSATLADGDVVEVWVDIEMNDTSSFSYDVTAKVNGKTATVDRNNGRWLRIYYTFTVGVPEVYVGGVGMFSGDYLAVGATETSTTMPESGCYAYYEDGVLNLRNYSYNGVGYEYGEDLYAVIYAPKEIDIILSSVSTLTQTESTYGTVIYLAEGGTIRGSNISGGSAGELIASGGQMGIYAASGDIIVNGGTLNVSNCTYGLISESYYEGDIVINDGTLNISATNFAIKAYDVTVNYGNVTARCINTVSQYDSNYYAICAEATFTFDNCIPKASVNSTGNPLTSFLFTDVATYDYVALEPLHTVTFIVDGEVYATEYAETGGTITPPSDPEVGDKTFLGWYTQTGDPFDFETPITQNVFLYAEFEEESIELRGDANLDGVIDVNDYQLVVNEALSDGNEQIGTPEYDEIIKYDLDGDGYVNVLDCAIMDLIVNGHREVHYTKKGDYDLDGEAYTESDLIAMYHVLSDIEGSAPTLSTLQKYASDLNCNGKVDEDDLTILVETYGTIEATTCEENVMVYYRWGNNYTTCTATAICTICDKHVAKETVNSVQNADGSYTATFTNTLLGTKTFKKQ